MWDKRIQRDDEFSDSEDEGEGGRKFRKDRKFEDDEVKPSLVAPAGRVATPTTENESAPTGLTGLQQAETGLGGTIAGLGHVKPSDMADDNMELDKPAAIGDTNFGSNIATDGDVAMEGV